MPTADNLFLQSIEANRLLKEAVLQTSAEGAERETRMAQLHTDRLDEMRAALLQEQQDRTAQIEQSAQGLRKLGTHLRLSKNQVLEPTADGSFPKCWAGGGIYSAVVEEIVHNGVDPATRSVLANEFLDAIKSNQRYFGGSFWIWRMKAKIPVGATRTIGFYQGTNTSSGESTLGCVVKHLAGMPLDGWMFMGAQVAPSKAQLLLVRNPVWSGGRHHSYSMMHGGFSGQAGDESEFLIALPSIVTGYVLPEDGWGNFPYVNQSED